jgi:YgiT-type zinc finger domain-containing protein
MSKTFSHKKDICAVCGGELRATTITHEERRGTDIYLFQHVPAQVCSVCGEIWIEEKTLQEIDRLIKTGEPTRRVETPVFDFALAGHR